MLGTLVRLALKGRSAPIDTGTPLDTGTPIETGMSINTPSERQAYFQGREAAAADIPRWRDALEKISDEDRQKDGVTIPAHETYQGASRPFLRHGGPGLHGYFDRLREEFRDQYRIQYWWNSQRGDVASAFFSHRRDGGLCKIYIRPFLPLLQAEQDLEELRQSLDWSNEEEIRFGRLQDEIAEIRRINAPGKSLPN